MGVGIWMRVDPMSVEFTRIVTVSASDPMLQTAAILIAIVGAVIMIIAFFGCVGACCEKPWMLLIVCLPLLLILETAKSVYRGKTVSMQKWKPGSIEYFIKCNSVYNYVTVCSDCGCVSNRSNHCWYFSGCLLNQGRYYLFLSRFWWFYIVAYFKYCIFQCNIIDRGVPENIYGRCNGKIRR